MNILLLGGSGDLGGSAGIGQLGRVSGNDSSGENGSAHGGDHKSANIDGAHGLSFREAHILRRLRWNECEWRHLTH